MEPTKPYKTHVFAHSTVFPAENDGVYLFADINGDGAEDLVYVKHRNTSSGSVEIHVADYESKFQKCTRTITTAFGATDDGTFLMQDQNGDGKADLVCIRLSDTVPHLFEVYISHAASGYRNIDTYAARTDKSRHEKKVIWNMSSNGDLIYINAGDPAKKVQCLRFPKTSNYHERHEHTLERLGTDEGGSWCIAPTCEVDMKPDLYYIQPVHPWTGKVVVHVDHGPHGHLEVNLPPSLNPTYNGRWHMVKHTHQLQPDLAFIKTNNTVSGKIEVLITSPVEVVTQSFIHSSRNARLESSPIVLRAELQRNDHSWRDASINLETFLGNVDGVFTWNKKGFHESARHVSLDGSLVKAELQKKDGSWVSASFDLHDKLVNNNGVFRAVGVPVFLGIQDDKFDDFLSHLSAAMDDPKFEIRQVVPSSAPHEVMSPDLATRIVEGVRIIPRPIGTFPDVSISVPRPNGDIDIYVPPPAGGPGAFPDLPDVDIKATEDKDGVTVFHANAGVQSGGVIFKTYTAKARASVIHIGQIKGKPIRQVDVDVLSVDVSTTVGTYLGADANVSLVKADASIFEVQLGVGVDSGIGIKDDSLTAKVAGFGFSVGRKMSIEVFGSSFGVDFGKAKDEIVDAANTVGHEIKKVLDTVEDGLETAGREIEKGVKSFLHFFGA
ncbi:hypothetical protein EC968_001305 [Mortierella alpina]|nr:hypothetical protein EC968_001305 [Mortierella alpina]